MSDQVFVLGSFVVDCAYRTSRMPISGETVLGSEFRLGPGGKGSNQAVAAARAGASVTFQTAIGDDAFGQIGRELWDAEGINASPTKRTAVATGSAAILLDEVTGANRIIVVPGACGELQPADLDAAAPAISTASALLAQLEIPLATVERGLAIARDAGVITVLNPAPALSAPLPADVLKLVDFLIPNETEAEALTGTKIAGPEDARIAAEKLHAAGAARVVITMGDQGALFSERGAEVHMIPAFQLGKVLDTTGAGDAFCGAFAAALARGGQALASLRFAAAAAGLSVLRAGTAPAMPRLQEIEAALASHG